MYHSIFQSLECRGNFEQSIDCWVDLKRRTDQPYIWLYWNCYFFPLMGHDDDYLIYRSIILLFEIYCWIPCWRLVIIPFQIHKKNHPFLKLLVDFLWQTLAKPCWPRSKKFAWPTKGFSCFLHHHFITSSWLFFYNRTRELCKQDQNLLTTAKKVAFSTHVARVFFSARGGEVLSSSYFKLISYNYSLISCWWLLIIIL